MKSNVLIAAVLFVGFAVTTASADELRTLEAEIDASSLTEVRLEAHVGDVVVAAAPGSPVRVEATLSPRRGGFFSSLKAAEKQVREATLETTVSGSVLTVRVAGEDDRRFEEDWAIILPPNLHFELQLGVGEVSITGLRGGVELESGVGEVKLDLLDGSIDAELGVGNIVVRAPVGAYGSAEASSGVGEAQIEVNGKRISGQGFVGHSAEWSGDGRHDIEAASGVGDVRIILE